MALAWLAAALCLLAGACSNDPQLSYPPQPAVPDGAGSGTVMPPDPEPGAVFGASGEEIPVSSPPANDGPSATETNFITPPCGDGSRFLPDGGVADAGGAEMGTLGDAGGPADADSPDSASDGGAAKVPCPNEP
jgi:hypothetical protein